MLGFCIQCSWVWSLSFAVLQICVGGQTLCAYIKFINFQLSYNLWAYYSNRFWVGLKVPQPFVYPFVYQPTCTTPGLIRAFNKTNRVSGAESETYFPSSPPVVLSSLHSGVVVLSY